MKLETGYNLKVIPLIQRFVNETAKIYGASEKEILELELAVEEAAEHIIVNYPSRADSAVFEIICDLIKNKSSLRVIMRNQRILLSAKISLRNYKRMLMSGRFMLILLPVIFSFIFQGL